MKNKGFYIILVGCIIIFSLILNRLNNEQKEKQFKNTLLQEATKRTVVNQDITNNIYYFKGTLENENDNILLEWDYDNEKVQEATILLNDQLLTTIKDGEKTYKVNIIDNKLDSEKNKFTLVLKNQASTTTNTEIIVDVGYIFHHQYSIIKINDILYLEFSYYTYKDSPISQPVIQEKNKMIVKEKAPSTKQIKNQYVLNKYYYEIDISQYNQGDHKEKLIWNIPSLNMQITQNIEFTK